MFSKKKEVRFPVKGVVDVIKNSPDKYKVEIRYEYDGRPSLRLLKQEGSYWSTEFFIFRSSSPILAHMFGSQMWYHSDELNWMEDHEKSYLYENLFGLGKQSTQENQKDENEQERIKFAKSFGIRVESQDETN